MTKKVFKLDCQDYEIHIKNINAEEKDFIDFKNQSLTKFVFVGASQTSRHFGDNVRDVHELRSKYKGQTYVFCPFTYNNEFPFTISFCEEGESPSGFAVISKRDLRTKHPLLKRATSEDVKEEAVIQMDNDVGLYNAMCSGLLYDYHIRYGNKEFEGRLVARTNEELYNGIISELPFIDDRFDADFKDLMGKN